MQAGFVTGSSTKRVEVDQAPCKKPSYSVTVIALGTFYAVENCTDDASDNVRNERSRSQVKLVKKYPRSSMIEDRLSALMMMKVHRQQAENMSVDELLTTFEQRHLRRMLLKCRLSSDRPDR